MCDSGTDMLGTGGYSVPGGPTSVDEPSRFSGLQTFSSEDSAADVSPVREGMLIRCLQKPPAGAR
jgi:hypothetical protein